MKLGVHCSIRKGFQNVLLEAKQLGINCLQMFTHSPRIWKFKPPDDNQIKEFTELRRKLKISPLIIHTAYLPNPASSNKEVYKKSKELLKLEMDLVTKFQADYLVMHPGSYSEGYSIQDGINQVVKCIDECFEEILKKYKNIKFMLLLENVCGNGRKLGRTFSELASIINRSNYSKFIGICIDTAHTFAYGYDIRDKNGIKSIFKELKENKISVDKIKLIHLNDSKTPLGSKIDLHQHIGEGYIGIEGFKTIISQFRKIPLILETPKETSFDKISLMDKKNLDIIRNISS